jgi:hypothetical protein
MSLVGKKAEQSLRRVPANDLRLAADRRCAVRNWLHVVMLAVPGWVAPAGRHERRYAAMTVSAAKQREITGTSAPSTSRSRMVARRQCSTNWGRWTLAIGTRAISRRACCVAQHPGAAKPHPPGMGAVVLDAQRSIASGSAEATQIQPSLAPCLRAHKRPWPVALGSN